MIKKKKNTKLKKIILNIILIKFKIINTFNKKNVCVCTVCRACSHLEDRLDFALVALSVTLNCYQSHSCMDVKDVHSLLALVSSVGFSLQPPPLFIGG